MAAKYNLQPDEIVLLKEQKVTHGGPFSAYTDELILTNQNLVLKENGLFGNSKGFRAFPLNQVKVHNNQAQALLGKAKNGSYVLEVYFLQGQETFGFQSGGKRKVLAWTTKINETVTGHVSPAADALNTGLAIPGADYIAGTLKDTINVFKNKLGTKSATTVTGKCDGCGAGFSSFKGQVVTCDYCGNTKHL